MPGCWDPSFLMNRSIGHDWCILLCILLAARQKFQQQSTESPPQAFTLLYVSQCSLSAESVSSCVYSLSRCALSAVCAAAPKNIVFCVICCSVSAPLLLLWEVVRLILKNKISNRPQSCGVRCSSSRATKQGIICIYYVKCTLCNSCAQCIAHTTAFYKI